MLKLLGTLVLLLTISGCSQAGPLSPELDITAPTPAPSQNSDQQPEVAPIDCDEETQREIEEAIGLQTRAFADDNYELAYSFASPSFRSNVSLDGFVAIIAGSYGSLIESSQLRFSGCLINASNGLGLIEVSFLEAGNSVYGLRYLMIETPDGWKVEGASNLQVVGEGT
jgi:predicted small lipoprotein YifL